MPLLSLPSRSAPCPARTFRCLQWPKPVSSRQEEVMIGGPQTSPSRPVATGAPELQPQQQQPAPPPSARRGDVLRNFFPQVAVLFCIGVIYIYVENSTFPTQASSSQGKYHVQMKGEGGGGAVIQLDEALTSEVIEEEEVSRQAEWRDSHADQLACDFPYQRVDPSCPRFVHLPITRGGGLGNKFFTYILGLLLAIDMKATHLYTGDEFRFDDHQDHGNYPWVEEVFQFGYREMNYSKAVDLYKPKVMDVSHQVWENVTRDYVDQCNVLFLADDFVCNYMICYYSETPRVYERTKAIMRCKMMHSSYDPPPLAYDPDTYNVAWHIRMGDGPGARLQSIHGGDRAYYERVREELDVVLDGFPVHYHFFAESPGIGNRAPPEFSFLEEVFPNATYHTNLPVKDTVVHMMSSDLLITSGSSFSFVAASMSYKPVVLFDRPKEGFFFGVYMDYDYVRLDNGRIAGQSLSEVRATVMYKWDLFHDHVVPGRVKLRDASRYQDDMSWRNLGKKGPPPTAVAAAAQESEAETDEVVEGGDGAKEKRRRGRRRLSTEEGTGWRGEEEEALQVMLNMLEHG